MPSRKLDSPELVLGSWTFIRSFHWNEWDRAAARLPPGSRLLDPRLSLKRRTRWPEGCQHQEKYDPSVLCCSVAIKAAEQNRGVSCESFHAEYKHSRASGAGSHCHYLGYHFGISQTWLWISSHSWSSHTCSACAELAWASSVAVSGSRKSWSSPHLLPGCRWSGMAASALRSWESLYCLCPVVFPLVLRQFFKIFFWGHRLGAAAASLPVFDLFFGRQPDTGQKDETLHQQTAFYPEAAELTLSQRWTDTHNKSPQHDVK